MFPGTRRRSTPNTSCGTTTHRSTTSTIPHRRLRLHRVPRPHLRRGNPVGLAGLLPVDLVDPLPADPVGPLPADPVGPLPVGLAGLLLGDPAGLPLVGLVARRNAD
jgi:hypothetical protein